MEKALIIDYKNAKERFLNINDSFFYDSTLEQIEDRLFQELTRETKDLGECNITSISKRQDAPLSVFDFHNYDHDFDKIIHFNEFSIKLTYEPREVATFIQIYI